MMYNVCRNIRHPFRSVFDVIKVAAVRLVRHLQFRADVCDWREGSRLINARIEAKEYLAHATHNEWARAKVILVEPDDQRKVEMKLQSQMGFVSARTGGFLGNRYPRWASPNIWIGSTVIKGKIVKHYHLKK